jgi:nanoRNase/pAp phosphatase (c-di-AMP/oligoRNAs hydrolase)
MSADNTAELFRIEDFDSFSVQVKLRNLTSKTGAGHNVVSIGSAPAQIRLIDFQETGFALEAPERSAAEGHTVDCEFDVTGTTPPLSFVLRAKVRAVTHLGESRERIDFSVLDQSVYAIQTLIGIYSKRQNEIEEFLKAARGGK